ncbi:hypothetical protein [Rubritalea profundi]|uniref:Sulfotransferase family protein n=1 Tax=Rubritalea profundi TaxID=1658618 RepID=A0A2S7U0R7_9BACT|nr:hypothetical protein [Rubritalea profundi]PQJ28061.1 hypothetical protein BSZ32_05795 [Rubritalea profundi]
MNRSLLDYSFREIGFRLFQKLGLKTRSEAHFSQVENQPMFDGQGPLLVSGVPRSGTTTILHEYARDLGYNALFEPLVFNHLGFDEEYFRKVAASFRANPEPNELAVQEVASGIYSHLSGMSCSATRERVRSLLSEHLDKLTNIAGRNVVIKELRWMGNLEEVDTILTMGEHTPKHILIDPDPYMVLYTHYRLGGLSEKNDFCNMAVDQMYERRFRMAFDAKNMAALVEYKPQNKWEKLLISVLIDRQFMLNFKEAHPDRVMFDLFTTLMNDKFKKMNELGFICSAEKNEDERVLRHSNRHLQDIFFKGRIQSKVTDELHQLVEDFSSFQRPDWAQRIPKPNFRQWSTNLSVVICDL